MIRLTDTIAAIATGMNQGGIGVIRVSGEKAIPIADSIFIPKKKGREIRTLDTYTAAYGNIVDTDGQMVDEVIVLVMKAPATYTKEDVVEIDCHGGMQVMQHILQLLIRQGARLADPGEFTKRAFLNGRIDLSQAESVMDLISAKSDLAAKTALSQLKGSLRDKIDILRKNLIHNIAYIESALDDPEHYDLTGFDETLDHLLDDMEQEIEHLIRTAQDGKMMKEGICTVILGKPNAGKSSVLNVLTGRERAIVTEIAGTTRDTLEEFVSIHGIPLNIIDTAGIRDTNDIIEQIGVEKSKSLAEQADLVLLMFDGSRELSDEDKGLIELVKNKKTITLVNKLDLEQKIDLKAIEHLKPINISVKSDMGINDIYEKIREMFAFGDININNEVLISGERNKESLVKAYNYLKNVMETVENRMPEDFISMDLTEAYSALGEITGEALEEDIIDKIFSEFCLGK